MLSGEQLHHSIDELVSNLLWHWCPEENVLQSDIDADNQLNQNNMSRGWTLSRFRAPIGLCTLLICAVGSRCAHWKGVAPADARDAMAMFATP